MSLEVNHLSVGVCQEWWMHSYDEWMCCACRFIQQIQVDSSTRPWMLLWLQLHKKQFGCATSILVVGVSSDGKMLFNQNTAAIRQHNQQQHPRYCSGLASLYTQCPLDWPNKIHSKESINKFLRFLMSIGCRDATRYGYNVQVVKNLGTLLDKKGAHLVGRAQCSV